LISLVASAASTATAATTTAVATATAAVATAAAGSAATAASAVATTATAAAATTTAAPALTLRASLVDSEGATIELGAILVRNRGLEVIGIDVKERETATFDDSNIAGPVLGESFLQTLLRAGVRDISDV
jgi:hypothetical protein